MNQKAELFSNNINIVLRYYYEQKNFSSIFFSERRD